MSSPRIISIGAIFVLAASLTLSPLQAFGQPVCKPQLSLSETRLSPVEDWKRLWAVVVSIYAAQCVTASGQFRLGIDRIQEYGPDLRFYAPFEWRGDRTEVSIVFGYDEAPVRSWVEDVAACPCQN